MEDEPMSDLVAFLRARYDERERVAREAAQGPWRVDDESYAETIYAADDTTVVSGGRWGGEASVFQSTADAIHIALNDPAYALADIASKRRILDMWEDPAWVEDPTLHPDVDPEHYQDGRDWNERDEQVAEANTIDQIVRLLAQPFRAHPDFDPAWAA